MKNYRGGLLIYESRMSNLRSNTLAKYEKKKIRNILRICSDLLMKYLLLFTQVEIVTKCSYFYLILKQGCKLYHYYIHFNELFTNPLTKIVSFSDWNRQAIECNLCSGHSIFITRTSAAGCCSSWTCQTSYNDRVKCYYRGKYKVVHRPLG